MKIKRVFNFIWGCVIIFTFFFLMPSQSIGQDVKPFEKRYSSMNWDAIVGEAKGKHLNWYMWGGAERINRFVTEYIAQRLKDKFDISLKMVPVKNATVFINIIKKEKQNNVHHDGSVDLVWVNGENFRIMKESGLLFGPYAERLPNIKYVDVDKSNIAYDFGYPVEGFESPYGSAQFIMIYDQARVPNPPKTIEDLLQWIKNHPGRFTFPEVPDHTGSVFARHLFYYVAGGYEDLVGPFNLTVFDRITPKLRQLIDEIKPYLWEKGRFFPKSLKACRDLFIKGDIDFFMSYTPSYASSMIIKKEFPETVRTFVFKGGTISNTHYAAIPFNSNVKAASMVLANLLLEPATQLQKLNADVWGDQTVLDINRLPDEWKAKFQNMPRHEATLPNSVLSGHQLPEIQSGWVTQIEESWRRYIRGR